MTPVGTPKCNQDVPRVTASKP